MIKTTKNRIMDDRIVGKNALESLTTGMYKDCRIIFREYIQNAADAIDQALQNGTLKKEESKIDIFINIGKKEIKIRDNGIGIPSFQVYKTLGDIGVTTKDYTKNRGFRGIGRLGGLGYCEELQFITSFKGENIKTLTTWNCTELKKLLSPNVAPNMSVIEVVNKVTQESQENELPDLHYFEVILKNVTNEKLLDFENIKDYLSQSAPVCFNYQHFASLKCINDNLRQRDKQPEEYNVFINHEQVFKPYRRKVTAGKENEKDFIEDILIFDSYKPDGTLFFMGWYGKTQLSGSIKDKDVNGIRVRKHNILIGDNYTLDPFFGDNPTYQTRNRWFIGEIYVYDDNLLPNARRDDFEENPTYFEFKKTVEYTTRELGKLPHEASKERNLIKKVDSAENDVSSLREEITKGLTNNLKEKVVDKINQIEVEIKKVPLKQQDNFKSNQGTNTEKQNTKNELSLKRNLILKELNDLRNQVNESSNFLVDQVPSNYSKEVRKIIRLIFEVISKELPQKEARHIQERIIAELKK